MEDKLLKENLGKQISLYYNDTANSVSFKKGIFKDFDNSTIKLLENEKDSTTLIPRDKLIRMEVNE